MQNTINISVTIDVENPQTPLFEKRFSDNRIWSDGYGIEKIIEILNKYGIKGSFFTNVYEYPIWGKSEMERIVKHIHDKGHDVELHTHPIWIDDKRRENMFQFPLREQESIIQWGADFIEKCTGRKPVCHRAGAYGFNLDTLRSCKVAGIPADSSNFYGHPNCKAIIAENEPQMVNGILELPVTFFKRDNSFIKTDIDWMNEEELQSILENTDNDDTFINLFLHSYSLTTTKDGFRSFEYSTEKAHKLENILKTLVNSKNTEIDSIGELTKRIYNKSNEYKPIRNIEISNIIAENTGKKILIFLNSCKSVDFVSKNNIKTKPVEFVTTQEEVANYCKKSNIDFITPRKWSYNYFHYKLPFIDAQKYEGRFHFRKTQYQSLFNELAKNTLFKNDKIRSYKDYDFYINGDYNSSHTLGIHLFYPIEVIEALINGVNPNIVISIDSDNDCRESYILQHYLKHKQVHFQQFKLGNG